MTVSTEIERFRRDHATPEAMAAFFSGVGPDASREAIASAFQAGGYNITLSDLDNSAKEYQVDSNASSASLSEIDLDMIVGGTLLPPPIFPEHLPKSNRESWKKSDDYALMVKFTSPGGFLKRAER